MARRRSTTSIIKAVAREHARAQREREKQLRAQEHERIRQEKIAKQQYQEERSIEVELMNLELSNTITELQTILEKTLSIDDTISFGNLRLDEKYKTPPQKKDFAVPRPSFFDNLIPGSKSRFLTKLENAKREYELKIQIYEEEKHAFLAKVQQRNQEVNEFEREYKSGDPDAIAAYCNMVLERSEYPNGFPQEFRIAYLPEPKEIVIEYELPTIEIIPSVLQYSYIKTKDEISEKARTKTEIKDLYRDIVSAIALRTIHEVIEADQGNHIDVVVFNGFIQTVDPATGHDVSPHLISVRTSVDEFNNIILDKVDKAVCLRNLGAHVSPRPEEAVAVRPLIEFNMVDPRFVEKSDVLSDLEFRPNLMDLDPFEFENLISNLFDQLGFDTKQTQTSRDGGVDAIAFDTRSIVGGKIAIQAKRYKNVVGVAAARDLYGTVINEGANKGILVTTSHYGKDAYEFVKDKPIELIDGGGLLFLLREVGVEARIVFPED